MADTAKLSECTIKKEKLKNEQDDENLDIDITSEDQNKICRFSFLHKTFEEIIEEKEKLEEEIKKLKDATEEIMTYIPIQSEKYENEHIFCKVGDSYILTGEDESNDYIENLIKKKENEMKNLEDKIAKIPEEMKNLKSYLYAKFKNKINLDK